MYAILRAKQEWIYEQRNSMVQSESYETSEEQALFQQAILVDTLLDLISEKSPETYQTERDHREGLLEIWELTELSASLKDMLQDPTMYPIFFDPFEKDPMNVLQLDFESWLLGWMNCNDTKKAKLTMFVDSPNDYSGMVVYGSWDNWLRPYALEKEIETKSWILRFSSQWIPKKGWHTYKLQKNGNWIEPEEHVAKQKNEQGVWNNVIYIHS
jgi:hypothetical protein